ncbi:MAG: alanine racemase [Herpetosiphon sp.]
MKTATIKTMIELRELLAVGGVSPPVPRETSWNDWCYDSRLAQPGQCFVALRTERRDGHDFIAAAVAAGCTGVLCSTPLSGVGVTVIVVDDVRHALQRWASERLRRVAPRVVAITGSVGKTGTKRAIASLLDGQGAVFQSRRSFNSLLGLPIALAKLEQEHRFAVLEMGVDRFGEMQQLAALFPAEIAVVTNVGATHLQFLRDEDHIAQEKGMLVAALPPHGRAVLYAGDARVRGMAARATAPVLWFGTVEDRHWINGQPGVWASNVQLGIDGTSFDIQYGAQTVAAHTPLLGTPAVLQALAAVTVALTWGMRLAEAAERLALIERQAGRLNPLPGLNGCTVLDDTYNASPLSVLAALETQHALPGRMRIAVLGPMLELGSGAEQLHREIGRAAIRLCDLVVTVGELAAHYGDDGAADVYEPHGSISRQASVADALEVVQAVAAAGDLVLVKGSAAARMEGVVAGLLTAEVNPAAVLVRQEAGWDSVRVTEPGRPTWLEIDLGAIRNNVQQIRKLVGPTCLIMAVLKADAYGHGAVHTARTVLQHGAEYLAVATVGEGKVLRSAGIDAPIVILGYTPPWQVRDAISYDIELAVFDDDVAGEVALATVELQRTVPLHVKVDTGMSRLGLAPVEVVPFLERLRRYGNLNVAGLFTHLATADSRDEQAALRQLQRFDDVVGAAMAAGLCPPLVHALNSAGVLRFPHARYDLVRPGLLLYGLDPSSETQAPTAFQPALQWKTRVAQIRHIEPGTAVSYGATWVAERPTVIATIPAGYADGFRRAPAWHSVLVRGQRAPVVGRVCMDYAMVDVTDIGGVRAGDEIVLIGRQGDDRISAEEVAGWLGTINYEVIAAILPRVPRVV